MIKMFRSLLALSLTVLLVFPVFGNTKQLTYKVGNTVYCVGDNRDVNIGGSSNPGIDLNYPKHQDIIGGGMIVDVNNPNHNRPNRGQNNNIQWDVGFKWKNQQGSQMNNVGGANRGHGRGGLGGVGGLGGLGGVGGLGGLGGLGGFRVLGGFGNKDIYGSHKGGGKLWGQGQKGTMNMRVNNPNYYGDNGGQVNNWAGDIGYDVNNPNYKGSHGGQVNNMARKALEYRVHNPNYYEDGAGQVNNWAGDVAYDVNNADYLASKGGQVNNRA